LNLNSAALKLMAEKGLTLEDVAEIVAANEVTRDPTASERQARCRARKLSQRDVTRDAPPNDIEILTPPDNPKPIGLALPKKSDRGSRLPADWTLPSEWRDWAMSRRRWAASEVEEEALLFANYWQAKAGAGACHKDWFKTWQNWAIRSHRPDGKSGGATVGRDQQIENLKGLISLYSRQGKHDEVREARRKLAELEAPANVVQLARQVGSRA
jgi:hypothetical protein